MEEIIASGHETSFTDGSVGYDVVLRVIYTQADGSIEDGAFISIPCKDEASACCILNAVKAGSLVRVIN